MATDEDVLDIVDELIKYSSVLEKWDTFAIRLGISEDERKQLRYNLNNGNIKYDELFRTVITKATQADDDVDILTKTVAVLNKMGLKGVAGKLKNLNKIETQKPDTSSPQHNVTAISSKRAESEVQDRVDMLMDKEPLTVIVKQSQGLVQIRPEEGYSLSSEPRGFALIINNINFPGGRRRQGAETDKVYMIHLLSQMGFDWCYEEDVRNQEELADHIKEFQKKFEEKAVDACIVVVMSHGHKDQVFMLDGSTVNIWEKIVYKFNNHDANVPQRIKEIPKIFIFQACQSWRTDSDSVKDERIPQAYMSDTLVCFSTMPGEEAQRDKFKGSWFVYCLVKVFMAHAQEMDLESMLKKVQSGELFGVRSETGYVQVCHWTPILIKKLFFNPKSLKSQTSQLT